MKNRWKWKTDYSIVKFRIMVAFQRFQMKWCSDCVQMHYYVYKNLLKKNYLMNDTIDSRCVKPKKNFF